MHLHVYELLDRINRAKSLAEIYQAALDAILPALRCDRASILLFDSSGVMRFVAWKGLSEKYRKAVEGHSPWARDAQNPQPVTIPDVASHAFEGGLGQVVRAEGIRALAFIPLSYAGKLLGKFMVYCSIPREFSADELNLARAIATEVAFAIQRQSGEDKLARLTAASEQQRRLYETILSNTPDFVYVFGRDHRFTYANEALLTMWGKTWDEAIGKNCLELGYPDWHAAMHDREIEQVIATKKPIRGEVPFTGTHGRRIYEYIFVPVIGADGEVEAIAGTTRDVTERKGAEEALRRSEQELANDVASLTRLNQIGVRFVDSDDLQNVLDEIVDAAIDLTHANKGNVQLFDPDTKTLKIASARGFSEPWLQFFSSVGDDTAACAVAMSRKARVIVEDVRTSPIFADTAALKMQLEERVLAVQSTPLVSRSGELLGMLSTHFPEPHVPRPRELHWLDLLARQAADLLARKRAEDALRESESRKSAILNSALDCIVTIDHESKIIEVNEAFERTFGYERTEAIGKKMADLIIPERYREAHYKGLARYVATGQGPLLGRRVELPVLRRDGTEFPAELGIVAIERQGRPLFTGTLRDITERKRSEDALAEAHAKLRHHAGELEARVKERTASLDDSIKSLETLLYTIAHDLRAPNRAMQGFAQLLMQGHADKLDDQGRFLLERISHAALRNDRLIHDLLEFGRLVHADFPSRAINPEPVIASVLSALDSEIKKGDAMINVTGPWPDVVANDSALTHVLTNLVSNAIKYVAPGTRPNVHIFPRVLPSSDPSAPARVRIYVEDNGIGVAPAHHERIFEPFQRAAVGDYEGTGMGLAIVRKAVERMGGSAGVESMPDQGSCFWVELTATATLQPSPKPPKLPG